MDKPINRLLKNVITLNYVMQNSEQATKSQFCSYKKFHKLKFLRNRKAFLTKPSL